MDEPTTRAFQARVEFMTNWECPIPGTPLGADGDPPHSPTPKETCGCSGALATIQPGISAISTICGNLTGQSGSGPGWADRKWFRTQHTVPHTDPTGHCLHRLSQARAVARQAGLTRAATSGSLEEHTSRSPHLSACSTISLSITCHKAIQQSANSRHRCSSSSLKARRRG
jgi:hypothetical protein